MGSYLDTPSFVRPVWWLDGGIEDETGGGKIGEEEVFAIIQVNKDEAWIGWGKKRGLLGKEMDVTQSYPLPSCL